MKIFLAGCEQAQFGALPGIVNHKTVLISYYHWLRSGQQNKLKMETLFTDSEVICDSGLFTLMFGAGKGGNYDLSFMKKYTTEYLTQVDRLKIPNLTIVECDVHKLLGMKAVFELRKRFEDCGREVLYVWHREEGIDGLMKMAEKYKYISISVPELRVILTGNKVRYQDAVKDLLSKIRAHVGTKMPKIHLLGNTVQETMETRLAYSCDSTAWLSGGRYGRAIMYSNGILRAEPISGDIYLKTHKILKTRFKKEFDLVQSQTSSKTEKGIQYMVSMYLSARSYHLYQKHLDRIVPWVGLEKSKNGN